MAEIVIDVAEALAKKNPPPHQNVVEAALEFMYQRFDARRNRAMCLNGIAVGEGRRFVKVYHAACKSKGVLYGLMLGSLLVPGLFDNGLSSTWCKYGVLGYWPRGWGAFVFQSKIYVIDPEGGHCFVFMQRYLRMLMFTIASRAEQQAAFSSRLGTANAVDVLTQSNLPELAKRSNRDGGA